MAFEVQIMCVDKTDRYNPHERIDYIGGVRGGKRWHITLDRAIEGIEKNEWIFYTLVNGHKRYVDIIKSAHGNKYLRTRGDSDTLDNLLSLNSCLVN